MNKIKENFFNWFQLKFKWVRIMLIGSVIVVLLLLFFPIRSKNNVIMTEPQKTYEIDTARSRILINKHLNEIVRKDNPRSIPPSSEDVESSSSQAKKSTDWKETISWTIGITNALVLILMNIKSLFTKKN